MPVSAGKKLLVIRRIVGNIKFSISLSFVSFSLFSDCSWSNQLSIKSYKATLVIEDSSEQYFHINSWRSQLKNFESSDLGTGSIEDLRLKLDEIFEKNVGKSVLVNYKVPNSRDQIYQLIDIKFCDD